MSQPALQAAADSPNVHEARDARSRRQRRFRIFAILLVIFVLSPITAWVLNWLTPAPPSGGQSGNPQLQNAYDAYIVAEGHAKRGAKFEQVGLALNTEIVGPRARTVNEAEVMNWLGPPDLFLDQSGSTQYVYFYDRFGSRDWCLYVNLDGKRNVTAMGWNASSVNDHSRYQNFPATVPVGR